MKEHFRNLVNFFIENEKKIVLVVGMILIVIISFTFGIMKGKGIAQDPLVIYEPENPPVVINSGELVSDDEKSEVEETLTTCVYVGSKKGTKYYPPTCSYAKKINPENLRCFSSDQDARDKGYTKSTSCD